jgi:hypothetical protein
MNKQEIEMNGLRITVELVDEKKAPIRAESIFDRKLEVESSVIRAIQYKPNDQELGVWFHSGSYYNYIDVPLAIFALLCEADYRIDGSVGSLFNKIVKGKFSCTRVEQIEE